jgi:transposase
VLLIMSEEAGLLFLGDDWAEAHHDIEIEDDSGKVLARRRLPEGLAGITALHELVAEHLDPSAEPDQVQVGIETERGPWVQALLAAGYVVYAVNPMQVARYRERHSTSGAKSDAADAHVLAEIVRLDRVHHRPIAGDSEIAEHVKVAARAHQTMIWSRVRQVNALRSLLREYYPAALAAFGTDLADRDALAVLAAAPTPDQGRRLSQTRIETLLRKAGRQRNLAATAAKIKTALGSEQLTARPGVVPAYAASASALIAVLVTLVAQTEVLAGQVEQGFGRHPDAEIYRSQPGLGTILGARVLAEFGDDPHRYPDAKSRKNYSGMSPITKASGTKRVVLARYARNRRLGDALFLQAYSALRSSPGARAYYDRQRARGATHYQALRAVANRLVGILHGCLRHHTLYDEHRAWPTAEELTTAA